jgi:hypothetical protein
VKSIGHVADFRKPTRAGGAILASYVTIQPDATQQRIQEATDLYSLYASYGIANHASVAS